MGERSRGLLHFLCLEEVVISTLWVPRKLEAIPLAGMDIARSTFDEAIARVVQRSELSARPGSNLVLLQDCENWEKRKKQQSPLAMIGGCFAESCSRGTCGFC
jgi:hypothetical protein